jgi:hypothetical protein
MAQDIPIEIVERVKGSGWLIPTPHEPFAEGGGAHVYLCYRHDLVASLEAFVAAAGPMAGPVGGKDGGRRLEGSQGGSWQPAESPPRG